MNTVQKSLASFVLLSAAATLPAFAGSSASSASSEGVSASVGSLSTSFEKSSNSSSKNDKVADGDYKVIEMAEAGDRPGMLRVKLQGNTPELAHEQFTLVMAAAAAQQGHLAPGAIVAARQREFGMEFAAGAPRQPFFLVVQDALIMDMQTKVVTL